MSKFKVGDKVRCVKSGLAYITKGRVYEIVALDDHWHRVVTDFGVVDGYAADVFELVEPNPVLTPEEVFEHLRKGTKLQMQIPHSAKWVNVMDARYATYEDITNKVWRIKPEPEVIELNGKKYREITE